MTRSHKDLDRESAIQPQLLAVSAAIEKWARGSRDGGKVWEVAGDILPNLWHDWGFYRSSPDVRAIAHNLMGRLTDIAVACDDQGVAEAVAAAKSAITLYRE
jgi:hypothetical protein